MAAGVSFDDDNVLASGDVDGLVLGSEEAVDTVHFLGFVPAEAEGVLLRPALPLIGVANFFNDYVGEGVGSGLLEGEGVVGEENGGLVDAGESGLLASFGLVDFVAEIGNHEVYFMCALPFSWMVSSNFLFLSRSFSMSL